MFMIILWKKKGGRKPIEQRAPFHCVIDNKMEERRGLKRFESLFYSPDLLRTLRITSPFVHRNLKTTSKQDIIKRKERRGQIKLLPIRGLLMDRRDSQLLNDVCLIYFKLKRPLYEVITLLDAFLFCFFRLLFVALLLSPPPPPHFVLYSC